MQIIYISRYLRANIISTVVVIFHGKHMTCLKHTLKVNPHVQGLPSLATEADCYLGDISVPAGGRGGCYPQAETKKYLCENLCQTHPFRIRANFKEIKDNFDWIKCISYWI